MKIDRDAFGKFFDGTPGKSWDDYAARLRNAAAGEVDDRGYSLADEYDGVAEGGPMGPAITGIGIGQAGNRDWAWRARTVASVS